MISSCRFSRGVFSSLAVATVLALGATSLRAAPFLWIDDIAGRLGRVDLATGNATLVGTMGVIMTDIAFAPNGDLYGISFFDLYRINSSTAAVTLIGPTGIPGGNALVFSSSGTLYAAGANSQLYAVNTTTGAGASLGGIGAASAGDLAFVGGKLYLSSTTDQLIEIALSPTVAATPVGPLGFASVFGMATPDNAALYGVTGNQIISVNVATGAGAHVINYSGGGLGDAYGSSFVSEAIPEPTSWLLATLGILGWFGRRGAARPRRCCHG